MTQRGSDTINWDSRGRNTGGTFGGAQLSYSFDPLDGIRSRVSGGITTRYLLGGRFETDGSGLVGKTFTSAPGGAVAQFAGLPTTTTGETFLYYSEHGDLAAEADATGSRTANHTYDPFGAPLDSPPANSSTRRYVGRFAKRYDTTTGLIQMGARPYDPALGRFIAVDPIDGGSLNGYDYAGQDPLNQYDLTGAATAPSSGGFSGNCAESTIEIEGLCRKIAELGLTSGAKTALVRGVEIFTRRMSRQTAERVVAKVERPIVKTAKMLGRDAKAEVHNAHHYFSRIGRRAEHIQITVWKAGKKGSHKIIQFIIGG